MIFHKISEECYEWLTKQKNVKEESLTDWMLYEIAKRVPIIKYKAFTRNEEAYNGSDWEWWVLVNTSAHETVGYRFLVQAKKIKTDKDNYSGIAYCNTNGLQIDLLIHNAINTGAMPLYAYYSCTQPELSEQVKNLSFIDDTILFWCEDCMNGCFISSAFDVKGYVFDSPRRRIDDIELLNRSIKLSILDWIWDNSFIELLDNLNSHFIHNSSLNQSIRHRYRNIPYYVRALVENKVENYSGNDWIEAEYSSQISHLSGVSIIDLRETNLRRL